MALLSFIGAQRQRLRSRLYQWGRALMASIPAPVLAWFAARLAKIRPLGWYGGWTFGAGEAGATPLMTLRLALWTHFADHRLNAPFVIRWHEHLRVTMYLGNDLSRCLYVGGTYEPNEFMFLSHVLKPGMTFIDVGANDGLYSMFAARRVSPSGRIIALEPSSREFGRLQQNVRINRLQNVHLIQGAASDREGTAILRIAGFGHEGQNTLGAFAYPISGQGTEEVRLTTLDTIASQHALDRIDVIKIDAEGGELGVLRGAAGVLRAFNPLLILEILQAALEHQGTSREAVAKFLQEFGYRFWIFGPSGPPRPISKLEEVDGLNVIAAPVSQARRFAAVLPALSG